MSRDARLLVCLTTIIICSLLFAFMPKVRTTTFREPAEIVRRTEDAAIAATATAKDIAAPPVLAERQRSLATYLRTTTFREPAEIVRRTDAAIAATATAKDIPKIDRSSQHFSDRAPRPVNLLKMRQNMEKLADSRTSSSSRGNAPKFLFDTANHNQDGLSDAVLAERQRSLVTYLRARRATPARGGATRATTKALRKMRGQDGVVRLGGKPLRRQDFGLLLNRLGLHRGKGMEIGVAKGKNCEALRKAWQGAELHCMDPWYMKGDLVTPEQKIQKIKHKRAAEQRMRALKSKNDDGSPRWLIAHGYANVLKRDHPLHSLEFAYIDARKSYHKFKEDLLDWLPRVQSGGLIAGHDYCNAEREGLTTGVRRAVEEVAKALRQGADVFVMDATHADACFRSWFFVA